MLKSLLGGGSQNLVGLDISSSSVKLLELSRSKSGQVKVEAYATESLPSGAVTDKQINDPKVAGEVIGRALAKSGTSTRQAAIAMAGAAVITKIIQLPGGLAEHEMEEQIKAEFDQYVPYKLEEVNLDFQVLDPVAGSDQVNVMLAACRKEQIEQRCAAIEMAGLKPKVVDIETTALENACEFLRHQMVDRGEKKTVVIVDVGGSNTCVTVLHDLKTVFTREQPFGGRMLVEDVMRRYGLPQVEAQRSIKQGGLPEDYSTELLPHFVADLAQQIDRNLQFFFSASAQFSSVDQILLAGGCAHIPDLEQIVQDKIKLPTTVARPLANMNIANRAKPKQLAAEEASLLVACGLALRAFDPVRD